MRAETAKVLEYRAQTPEDLKELVAVHYRGREVVCPVCAAPLMAPCSTRREFRVSGSHEARIALAEEKTK